jgi:hypothetical protein
MRGGSARARSAVASSTNAGILRKAAGATGWGVRFLNNDQRRTSLRATPSPKDWRCVRRLTGTPCAKSGLDQVEPRGRSRHERAEMDDDHRGLIRPRCTQVIGLVDESSAHRRREDRSATRRPASGGVQQIQLHPDPRIAKATVDGSRLERRATKTPASAFTQIQ